VSPLRRAAVSRVGLALVSASACQSNESAETRKDSNPPAVVSASPRSEPGPRLLYLPDGGDQAHNQGGIDLSLPFLPSPSAPGSGACPAEMVSVQGRFCIDRYEASMVDARSSRPLSPYYPPAHGELLFTLRTFRSAAVSRRAPAMPVPPDFSVQEAFSALPRSVAGVVPHGYTSGIMAKRACEAAGKRLCSQTEWTLACRGERNTKFPYGASYAEGGCNVFREAHPAVIVYGDASRNHLDPRLNLAEGSSGPLLRKTGATPSCRSTWGQDAIFDMVGNLDEWVESETGAFQGGFYARGTREGCDARITVHPPQYLDYSLGVRCCR
jgi:sulfatase modifying factor 1